MSTPGTLGIEPNLAAQAGIHEISRLTKRGRWRKRKGREDARARETATSPKQRWLSLREVVLQPPVACIWALTSKGRLIELPQCRYSSSAFDLVVSISQPCSRVHFSVWALKAARLRKNLLMFRLRNRSGTPFSTTTQPQHQLRAWLSCSVKCIGAKLPERCELCLLHAPSTTSLSPI